MTDADIGRVPAEPGSHEPSPAVSAAGGFDPSRERPSSHGAMLGETLSDIAKAGAVGTDLLSAMCVSCAFREGCMTNQMAATGSEALDCLIGIDDTAFYCHQGLKEGRPTKVCAGWVAAKLASFDVVRSSLLTLQHRLANIPDPDPVRLHFDAWLAEVDPEMKMDSYQWAKLFAKRDSDTRPKDEDEGNTSASLASSAGRKASPTQPLDIPSEPQP